MAGILALDLATRTGFALWTPGRDGVQSGTYSLPRTGSDVGSFLHAYERWLTPLIDVAEIDTVVFEAPWVGPQTSQDTARKLLCLAGMTEYVCTRDGVRRCLEANNATVRKHFIGKGRGDRKTLKSMTMKACAARGWNPANDDEADALAVLDYAAHCYRLEVPWACGALFAGAA